MATWYQELDDGRLRLWYSSGSGKNRIRKSKIVKMPKGRKRDREKAIELLLEDFENYLIDYQPSSSTLDEFAWKWLEYKKGNIAPTTYDSYFGRYDLHIKPYLGDKNLSDVSTLDVVNLEKLLKSKLASRTVKDIIDLLGNMISDAVKWKEITENPVSYIDPVRVVRKEPEVFWSDQLPVVFEYINREPLQKRLVFLLALVCGLRRSEIVGLNDNSINFSKGTIKVSQAYVRSSEGNILKETKSKRVRYVGIPDFLSDLIKEYIKDKVELGISRIDEPHKGALFIQIDGKRLYPSTPTQWWNKFMKKHPDLPRVTFHGLRHTMASLLMSESININSLASWLGHSRPSTTTDIYGHVVNDVNKEIINRMEKMLKSDN